MKEESGANKGKAAKRKVERIEGFGERGGQEEGAEGIEIGKNEGV